MNEKNVCFFPAEILLPDFDRVDGTKWAVIACDQYTSEPNYWEQVAKTVGDAPSTLSLILPEVYLSEAEARIPAVNEAMKTSLESVLQANPDAMIYLERTQADGRIRRGIIGAIDLACYDYKKGSQSLVRATEGTVLERIPPRVAIRRNAPIELPHVMLLIDDPARTVIEPHVDACNARKPIYDFDLMLESGHVRGFLLTREEQTEILASLGALITPEQIEARYGDRSLAPLLFAVGDGNHSLATAKATYEELKARIGDEALDHPARYALAEVVNLHDEALTFEPIYRVVFGVDPTALLNEWTEYVAAQNGTAAAQTVRCITADRDFKMIIPHPTQQLTVGTLQAFLTEYTARHPEAEVDYIHGEDSLLALAKRPNAVGFLFDGMRKDELFRTVIYDGALPRKTFSMGHAYDKRFYLESKRITK
jgi:uncharacterized protein (DUF1015 family)